MLASEKFQMKELCLCTFVISAFTMSNLVDSLIFEEQKIIFQCAGYASKTKNLCKIELVFLLFYLLGKEEIS